MSSAQLGIQFFLKKERLSDLYMVSADTVGLRYQK